MGPARQKPHTKEHILALLHEEGERFAGWLDTLTEEFLAEMVAMPPAMARGLPLRVPAW